MLELGENSERPFAFNARDGGLFLFSSACGITAIAAKVTVTVWRPELLLRASLVRVEDELRRGVAADLSRRPLSKISVTI